MSAISCAVCGIKIDYRSVTGLCKEHWKEETGGKLKPMPEDFPIFSANKSWRELAARYGVSRSTITVWRRESAMAGGKRLPWSEQEDGVLRSRYGTIPNEQIGAMLNRSGEAVKSRAKLLGLVKRSLGVFIRRETQTRLNAGHTGEAAYLQAYGPIYRCYSDGTQNTAGHYWYWAGQVLTHDEMEAKARAHRERRQLLAA